MPDPNSYEKEDDFMGVCVPKMIKEGKKQDQAVAACMSMWKNKGKDKDESKGENLSELRGKYGRHGMVGGSSIYPGPPGSENDPVVPPHSIYPGPPKKMMREKIQAEIDIARAELKEAEEAEATAASIYSKYTDAKTREEWQKAREELKKKKKIYDDLFIKLGKNEERNMSQDFIFVELSTEPEELKYIDGLAAGTFTAMNGREVSFDKSDLPDYVANTLSIIESTRTEKGEIVGLPIDRDGHDHKGGAGWIVGLELDTTRNIIKFVVKWTKEGIDLIKGNIRRFFSPSADPSEKVILGGSLTNWPATRDVKGKMLLRPVELSQNIKEIDMPKTIEELQVENQELTAKLQDKTQDDSSEVNELNEWMSSEGDGLEELSRKAQEKAELIIRAERRKDKAVEFASKVIGGTREKPFGLPIKSSRLVKLLLSLPEKQAAEVQELIGLIYKNAIDFAEHGIDGSDYSMKPKLPAEFSDALRIWVDSGKPAKSWFAEMGETVVGKAEDWNLTEYNKAEE